MRLSAEDQGRLGTAFALACRWHGDHTRKGTDIPYVSHLLQVAGLVLEHGGSVDQAAAGLLHDAVEDTDATLAEIEDALGPTVASIVAHCTDTLPGDTPSAKSPWAERKQRYVAALREAPAEVALVSACDKTHNLASLLADARAGGAEAISPPRFSAPPSAQLRYYEDVIDAVSGRVPDRLVVDLRRLLSELRAVVG